MGQAVTSKGTTLQKGLRRDVEHKLRVGGMEEGGTHWIDESL